MVEKKTVKIKKAKTAAVKKPAAKSAAKKKAMEEKAVAAQQTAVVKEKPAAESAQPTPVTPVSQPARPYLYAVGRRKEAVARVRLFEKGDGQMTINGREFSNYFPSFQLKDLVLAPLKLTGEAEKVDVSIKVLGGGKQGQAEAARHGLSRALVKLNPDFKPTLKKAGFLTRDPRVKERKKFGLKKARRAPQWAKR